MTARPDRGPRTAVPGGPAPEPVRDHLGPVTGAPADLAAPAAAPPAGPDDPWQVPRVEALASLRPSGGALFAGRWSARHLVALVVLFPLVLWWFASALPSVFVPGALWWGALGLAALLGAAALATYVPAPRTGTERTPTRSCGAPAALLVVLAALSLGGAVPSLLSALPVLVLTAAALVARVVTAATCR